MSPLQPDLLRRRFFIVVSILALTATLTLLVPLLSAPISGKSYASRVSLTLGDYIGTDRAIDPSTAAVLQTDDVVDRRYVKPDKSWVDLTIVFAKEQRKVAHPQEICLKGAGFNIQDYSRVSVPTGLPDPAFIPVVKLRIEHGAYKYLVYYWYKCGSRHTASYYWENFLVIWSQVSLHPANGALVKLTTPIDLNLAASEQRLNSFLNLVMPEIISKLP